MNISGNLTRLIEVISMITYRTRTRQEIMDELTERGYEISNRTFDRIISDIRELGFTVETGKDFGYRITDSEDSDEQYKMILTLNTLIASQSRFDRFSSNLIDEYILQNKFTYGIDFIPLIMDALKEKNKLSIQYQKFRDTEPTNREVIPLKLMKTEYRWYLISYDLNAMDLRTFALDRILKTAKGDRFKPTEIPDSIIKKSELYSRRVGASPEIFEEKPDEVIEVTIAVTQIYLPYIKTLQIHSSQVVTDDKIGDSTLIKLWVIPTRDLIKRLASELGDLKIVGPQVLIDYVKKEYPELKMAIVMEN